jgi:hypothetical protein
MQNKHEKKWCEPLEHVVKQPTRKDTNSQKATKSGLVGVWHKDNFYLSTSTTGNENPHPTNIDSQTRSIRMTPRSQLLIDKLFFSFLENQGMEIIPPTHNKCSKRSLLIWKLRNPYMSVYAFIYTDSRLKQTLMNPYVDLYEAHLQLNPNNINKTLK